MEVATQRNGSSNLITESVASGSANFYHNKWRFSAWLETTYFQVCSMIDVNNSCLITKMHDLLRLEIFGQCMVNALLPCPYTSDMWKKNTPKESMRSRESEQKSKHARDLGVDSCIPRERSRRKKKKKERESARACEIEKQERARPDCGCLL